MKMKKRSGGGDEEEEAERLINEEYVEPSAAGKLLRKFPDNSAFDFDYSQSSIWSPLLRRPFSPADLDPTTPTTLCYSRSKKPSSSSSRNSSSLRRKKTKNKPSCCASFGFSFLTLNLFNLKRKHPTPDFSPTPRKPNKGCEKVLKAAAKHFKKKKNNKKKDPSVHVKLSTYLMMDPN